jgi:hypothetical protein
LIEGGKVFKAKKLMFPRLSLSVLIPLTPADIPVLNIEEHFEEIPFEDVADLAGIVFMSPKAPKAYPIGAEIRRQGRLGASLPL